MKIGIVDVFVEDQDRARAFYTEKLGLRVKDDAAYGPGIRWLTVVSPEDPDGTELLLTPLDDAAKDCQRTYDQLRERGVTFLSEPREMSYGGIDAVFQDGCGNLINLHQEARGGTGG